MNDGGAAFPHLSDNERKALFAITKADSDDSLDLDFSYMNFAAIARRSGLDHKLVRRTVRALARKGLAQFASGLCTEDGDFYGSGYAPTELALDYADALLRARSAP